MFESHGIKMGAPRGAWAEKLALNVRLEDSSGGPVVTTFLPRSKSLSISWLQSPSAVILRSKKIKSDTVSTVSPSTNVSLLLLLLGGHRLRARNLFGALNPHSLKNEGISCGWT